VTYLSIENDCPALKDIERIVVPRVHYKWHDLGLQLLDSSLRDHFLYTLKTNYQSTSQQQCIQVFMHWLDANKKPTWGKIIEALNTQAVNLPSVACDIEKMLDNRVSIM